MSTPNVLLDSASICFSATVSLNDLSLINNMKTRKNIRLKAIRPSHRPEKKWDAVFEYKDTKTTFVQPFGQRGYSDYTKHKDDKRKQRYIARHKRMHEDWDDPTRAGTLSRYILWNKKTRKASIEDYKKRFHL